MLVAQKTVRFAAKALIPLTFTSMTSFPAEPLLQAGQIPGRQLHLEKWSFAKLLCGRT
jgi:hypothetical protein